MPEDRADAVDFSAEAGCVVGIAGEGEVGGVEVVVGGGVFVIGGGG